MKDANLMSPEELRKLAKEKEENLDKPIKEGFLKHDLYTVDMPEIDIYTEFGYGVLTKEDTKSAFLFPEFKKVLSKGDRFICFLFDGHDEEMWYDDVDYGVEEASDKWAKEHLENIRLIKRNKK